MTTTQSLLTFPQNPDIARVLRLRRATTHFATTRLRLRRLRRGRYNPFATTLLAQNLERRERPRDRKHSQRMLQRCEGK